MISWYFFLSHHQRGPSCMVKYFRGTGRKTFCRMSSKVFFGKAESEKAKGRSFFSHRPFSPTIPCKPRLLLLRSPLPLADGEKGGGGNGKGVGGRTEAALSTEAEGGRGHRLRGKRELNKGFNQPAALHLFLPATTLAVRTNH